MEQVGVAVMLETNIHEVLGLIHGQVTDHIDLRFIDISLSFMLD
jgi:hypothetical protein